MVKAVSQVVRSTIQPMSGGETASPRAWTTKILSAKAVGRSAEDVTLASAVFAGPVLKKRKNTAQKSATHAYGNGHHSMASVQGKAIRMAIAETKRYAPW